MKQSTKYNLKNIFGSTISNECAINAARTLPWWSGVIAFLLGVIIPLIPLVVNVARTSGSDYISSTNYGYDRDITTLSLELHNNGSKFIVNDDKLLEYYVNDEKQEPSIEQDVTPIARYINTRSNQYELDIFYSVRETSGDNKLSDLTSVISARKFVKGTMNEKGESDEDSNCYTPSFVIFHKNGLINYLYKTSTTTTTGGVYSGDWKRTPSGEDVLTRMLTVEGYEIPETIESSTNANKYIAAVYENYKGLYDECYLETINRLYLINTTVYFGVYAGLVILLGFIMFLLTRGKRNPNRYLKWYQCMLISFWSCFAPGLLAMVFGFIIPNFAIMFFIVFMGLRVMWMSMKQLSPGYTQA